MTYLADAFLEPALDWPGAGTAFGPTPNAPPADPTGAALRQVLALMSPTLPSVSMTRAVSGPLDWLSAPLDPLSDERARAFNALLRGSGDAPPANDPAALLQPVAANAGGPPPRSQTPATDPAPAAGGPRNPLDPVGMGGVTNALDPLNLPAPSPLALREQDLRNPNVKAFLTLLSQSEGATYNSLAGDHPTGRRNTFSDFSRYPGGIAGRYQIIPSTYKKLSDELGLADYSPHTQDLLAAQAIADRGAMPALLKGDLDSVLQLVAKEWASLPQGKEKKMDVSAYPRQPYLPYERVRAIFDAYATPWEPSVP